MQVDTESSSWVGGWPLKRSGMIIIIKETWELHSEFKLLVSVGQLFGVKNNSLLHVNKILENNSR